MRCFTVVVKNTTNPRDFRMKLPVHPALVRLELLEISIYRSQSPAYVNHSYNIRMMAPVDKV